MQKFYYTTVYNKLNSVVGYICRDTNMFKRVGTSKENKSSLLLQILSLTTFL